MFAMQPVYNAERAAHALRSDQHFPKGGQAVSFQKFPNHTKPVTKAVKFNQKKIQTFPK
jgi:hypothetical protein